MNNRNRTTLRLAVAAGILAAGGFASAMAQDVAIKTNLIGDALLNPNLAVEVGVAPKWTVELSGQWNAWTVGNDHRWKHWVVQPEARYWFCERFSGHFVAIHALGGQYNVGNIGIKKQIGRAHV